MNAGDVVETLPVGDWRGPFQTELQARARDTLESGRVLLAHLPFVLLADEAPLLSSAVMGSDRKNISFDPASGSLSNTSLSRCDAKRLRALLRRFGDMAEQLLHDLLPA